MGPGWAPPRPHSPPQVAPVEVWVLVVGVGVELSLELELELVQASEVVVVVEGEELGEAVPAPVGARSGRAPSPAAPPPPRHSRPRSDQGACPLCHPLPVPPVPREWRGAHPEPC